MATNQDLAQYIGQMEGFGKPGVWATINNNPGNLRWAPNQVGTNGGFAVFATVGDGWQALLDYIGKNASLSLRSFIYKYAPPTENDTSNYLNFLSGKLGIGPEQSISALEVSSGGFPLVGGGSDSDLAPTDVGNSSEGAIDPMLLAIVGGAFVLGLVLWGGGR